MGVFHAVHYRPQRDAVSARIDSLPGITGAARPKSYTSQIPPRAYRDRHDRDTCTRRSHFLLYARHLSCRPHPWQSARKSASTVQMKHVTWRSRISYHSDGAGGTERAVAADGGPEAGLTIGSGHAAAVWYAASEERVAQERCRAVRPSRRRGPREL